MGENSKISWTDHTFNPYWGCTKISEACRFCYAEIMGNRFGVKWGDNPRRTFGEKHWNEPLNWNRKAQKAGKRAKVFCGSMCDIFEKGDLTLDLLRTRLFQLIEKTPWLIWMLLTKRPENIAEMIPPEYSKSWPRNVWLGVTAENQEYADKRILILLHFPSPVLFISVEPMLSEMDIEGYLYSQNRQSFMGAMRTGVLAIPGNKLSWVIAGGESGENARPTRYQWAENLLDQCQKAGVPYFFKQWGEWKPGQGLFGEQKSYYDVQPQKNGLPFPVHLWDKNNISLRCGREISGDIVEGHQYHNFPAESEWKPDDQK